MHVTLFGFVLFLHIFVVIVAFMMAAVMHAALPAMARARDVREVRSWAALVHRMEPLFPLSALLILGLGAWLIHLSKGEFGWSDGWLLTALITLVVIEGLSGAFIAPKARAAIRAVDDAPDGPVSDDLRRHALQPVVWHLTHVATFGFAGVVFLMAGKPSGAWAVVIVVVAAAIGLAVSAAQLRMLSPAAEGAAASLRAETAQ